MILYLDTSAFVKLYVEEEGSEQVRREVERAEVVSSSRIAYLETRTAFARKYREVEIEESIYSQMVHSFERDWQCTFVIEISQDLLRQAAKLSSRYPLRSLDALHLASALFQREESDQDIAFSCFDLKLNEAARSEGLQNPS